MGARKRDKIKMKVAPLLLAIAHGFERKYELVNNAGERSLDGGATWEADPKGPRICNGKKIPEIENGSWKCERNLNKEGDEKEDGRKCRLKCDEGFKPVDKNGDKPTMLVKCKSKKGWRQKPKGIECISKVPTTTSTTSTTTTSATTTTKKKKKKKKNDA